MNKPMTVGELRKLLGQLPDHALISVRTVDADYNDIAVHADDTDWWITEVTYKPAHQGPFGTDTDYAELYAQDAGEIVRLTRTAQT